MKDPAHHQDQIRHAADAVRIAIAVSAAAAWFTMGGGTAIRFVVLLAIAVGVRRAKLPALFDLAVCVVLLLATWAGVLNWYVEIAWMDEVVHFLTIPVLTAATYLALSRIEVLPDMEVLAHREHPVSVTLLLTMLGFAIATLWEFFEWVAEQFFPKQIHVGYDDTILDLALGGLGAAIAGVVLALTATRFADGRIRR